MKRYCMLALALVLGCTIFTGCRRGNGNMDTVPSTAPAVTEMPTLPTVQPTRPAATEPATMAPTEDSTANPATDGSMDQTEDASGATEDSPKRALPQRPNMR